MKSICQQIPLPWTSHSYCSLRQEGKKNWSKFTCHCVIKNTVADYSINRVGTCLLPGFPEALSPRENRWALWKGSFKVTGNDTIQQITYNFLSVIYSNCVPLPSVLWRCWLGGRKEIPPAKTEWWWLAWLLSVWSEVQMIWIWWIHLMPLPPHHLSLY